MVFRETLWFVPPPAETALAQAKHVEPSRGQIPADSALIIVQNDKPLKGYHFYIRFRKEAGSDIGDISQK